MPHTVAVDDRGREQARRHAQDLNGFNYGAPAELFPSRGKAGKSRNRYERFDTAAEALRFVMERMPAPALLGTYMEVEEARFGAQEIRYLYESAAYPLSRASEPS
jgi:hypothetical protein